MENLFGKGMLRESLTDRLAEQSKHRGKAEISIAMAKAAIEVWGALGDEEELRAAQDLLKRAEIAREEATREIEKLRKALDLLKVQL